MSFEETLASVLKNELEPLRAEIGRLTAELQSVRQRLPPALVTMKEAAATLGLSLSTVKRRVRDGSLPARGFGRSLRVDLTGLHPIQETEVANLARIVRKG